VQGSDGQGILNGAFLDEVAKCRGGIGFEHDFFQRVGLAVVYILAVQSEVAVQVVVLHGGVGVDFSKSQHAGCFVAGFFEQLSVCGLLGCFARVYGTAWDFKRGSPNAEAELAHQQAQALGAEGQDIYPVRSFNGGNRHMCWRRRGREVRWLCLDFLALQGENPHTKRSGFANALPCPAQQGWPRWGLGRFIHRWKSLPEKASKEEFICNKKPMKRKRRICFGNDTLNFKVKLKFEVGKTSPQRRCWLSPTESNVFEV